MKTLIRIVPILLIVVGVFFFLQKPQLANKNTPRVTPNPKIETTQTLGVKTEEEVHEPQKLIISKLNINADIEMVGLDKQNRMDVPKDAFNVGFYSLGGKIGERGNAVMAGHLDLANGNPAVFYNLGKLQIGDIIEVKMQSGKSINYKVTGKNTYEESNFPLQEVFGETDKKRLNLITCEGTFNTQTQNYSQRTVIYSELVE